MVKGLRVNATFGPTVWHVTSNSIAKDSFPKRARLGIAEHLYLVQSSEYAIVSFTGSLGFLFYIIMFYNNIY